MHTACRVVGGPRRLHGGLTDRGARTNHVRGHAVGFLVQPADVTVAADVWQRRAIFVDQGLGKANVSGVRGGVAAGSRRGWYAVERDGHGPQAGIPALRGGKSCQREQAASQRYANSGLPLPHGSSFSNPISGPPMASNSGRLGLGTDWPR